MDSFLIVRHIYVTIREMHLCLFDTSLIYELVCSIGFGYRLRHVLVRLLKIHRGPFTGETEWIGGGCHQRYIQSVFEYLNHTSLRVGQPTRSTFQNTIQFPVIMAINKQLDLEFCYFKHPRLYSTSITSGVLGLSYCSICIQYQKKI